MKLRFLYQLPALVWMILTFVLSSIPDIPTPDLGIQFEDKLYHFFYYALYGLLLALALFKQDKFPRIKLNYLLFTVFFGSLYGLTDEIHQGFVPGREMDFLDFVADVLGVLAGAIFFKFLINYFKRNKSSN